MYAPLQVVKERIVRLMIAKKLQRVPIAYLKTIIRAKPELVRSACFELTMDYPDMFMMDDRYLYLIPKPEELIIKKKEEEKEGGEGQRENQEIKNNTS